MQSIIAFRWGPCKRYVLLHQMMPYCGFFIAYLIYVFYILDLDEEYRLTHEENEIPTAFIIFESTWNVLLLFWSLFFLAAERRQLVKAGWSYFKDVWNYADVVPPVLIILIVLVDYFARNEERHPGVSKFRFSM